MESANTGGVTLLEQLRYVRYCCIFQVIGIVASIFLLVTAAVAKRQFLEAMSISNGAGREFENFEDIFWISIRVDGTASTLQNPYGDLIQSLTV